MSIPGEQIEVALFLAGLSGAKPVETPLSAVFLGEDTAWKLRKAVHFPFVDFSTLAARRQASARDFELNRAAAPGIYRDVVPVTRGPEGLRFGGDGPALDWVVRMARVPEDDFLDVVARHGELAPFLCELGDVVAQMHARLAPCHIDHIAAMRRVLEGNLATALEAGIDASALAPVMAGLRTELARISPWLAAREQAGFVRRAHGDLHLGNLCLWQGHPVPFDALEFDEAMATIDLGYDLAFVLMDLDRLAGRAAANTVLNRYVARTGDVGLLAGLGLFIAMRALIRAHVTQRMGDDPADYLARAMAALSRPKPFLLALGGLPGSGKSTLARRVAPGLGGPGAVILRADEARKRHFGVAPEARLPASAYDEDISKVVKARLLQDATIALAAGHSVILDTTFLDAQDRDAAKAAAGNAMFVGAWLEAPLAELEARVAARVDDASDATVDVLRRAAQTAKPPADWRHLDTSDTDAVARFVGDVTQLASPC
jgi:aminoglycoside phosphotransferase family enzyme/predicted kinase